jgi:hypothetical protein
MRPPAYPVSHPRSKFTLTVTTMDTERTQFYQCGRTHDTGNSLKTCVAACRRWQTRFAELFWLNPLEWSNAKRTAGG